MSVDPAPAETIAERYARLLAGHAERVARVTADLEDRYRAAEDDETAVKLAQAMAVMGRSLRQTIALGLRMDREATQTQQKVHQSAEAARARQVELRKSTARAALLRLLWTEYENEQFDFDTSGLVRSLVEEVAEAPDFADAPIEPLLASLTSRFHHALAECADKRAGGEDGEWPSDKGSTLCEPTAHNVSPAGSGLAPYARECSSKQDAISISDLSWREPDG